MIEKREALISEILKDDGEYLTYEFLSQQDDEYLSLIASNSLASCYNCPAFSDCKIAHTVGCDFTCEQAIEVWLAYGEEDALENPFRNNKEAFVAALKSKYPDILARADMSTEDLLLYLVDVKCRECPAAHFCYWRKRHSIRIPSCKRVMYEWLEQ